MGKHRHFVGNDRSITCGGINMYSAKKKRVPNFSIKFKRNLYPLLLLRAGPVCAGSSREHRETFVNSSPLRQRSAPIQTAAINARETCSICRDCELVGRHAVGELIGRLAHVIGGLPRDRAGIDVGIEICRHLEEFHHASRRTLTHRNG